jgi:hypothetical protein
MLAQRIGQRSEITTNNVQEMQIDHRVGDRHGDSRSPVKPGFVVADGKISSDES